MKMAGQVQSTNGRVLRAASKTNTRDNIIAHALDVLVVEAVPTPEGTPETL